SRMGLKSRLIFIAVLAFVMVAQSRREAYRFGFVVAECGRMSIDDHIVLTTRPARCFDAEPVPRLTFTFKCCLAQLPQTRITDPENRPLAGASRCNKRQNQDVREGCVRPTSGHVKLDRLDDNGASGEYEFSFADGDHESGRFDVKRCKSKAVL